MRGIRVAILGWYICLTLAHLPGEFRDIDRVPHTRRLIYPTLKESANRSKQISISSSETLKKTSLPRFLA